MWMLKMRILPQEVASGQYFKACLLVFCYWCDTPTNLVASANSDWFSYSPIATKKLWVCLAKIKILQNCFSSQGIQKTIAFSLCQLEAACIILLKGPSVIIRVGSVAVSILSLLCLSLPLLWTLVIILVPYTKAGAISVCSNHLIGR